jgi:excisionase family DNA binding protein
MEKLLSPKELADFLQISTSSIYRLTSQKKIPHVKCFGSVRFERERITEWVKTQRIEPGRHFERG